MDSKISDLTLATSITGADVLPIVNGGTTKKVTVTKIQEGLATTTYVNTQDALKVDKVAGKGLSTEDYTTTEKSKLAGIASGAEVNVNADWNAVSGDAQILNKPTIPTAVTQTSQLTNNGADGVNPFITALDIPVAGQASTLVREVKNMTGATLTKGTVVYISGANGNKALVSKALATTDALSSRTFGMLQSDILNNGLGNCVIIGDLTGVDTSSFTEGAQLYLSGVTAGTYTASKILAPTHLVYVGKVTRSHPTLGQIEVGIQNGYELAEIHDVAISTPINNDALVYETATGLWKNKQVTSSLSEIGATPNANGATLTGSVLNLQPADGTNGGVVTTGTQTFAGAKTFNSQIQASNGILGNPDWQESYNVFTTNGSYFDISGKQNSSIPAYSLIANNTNGTTIADYFAFRKWNLATYSLTPTWTGTTNPTVLLGSTYSGQQVGNMVSLNIALVYSVAGVSNTQVILPLPTDFPTPLSPTGFTGALDIIAYGTGMIVNSTNQNPPAVTGARNTLLRRNTANNGYEILSNISVAVNSKVVIINITYQVS